MNLKLSHSKDLKKDFNDDTIDLKTFFGNIENLNLNDNVYQIICNDIRNKKIISKESYLHGFYFFISNNKQINDNLKKAYCRAFECCYKNQNQDTSLQTNVLAQTNSQYTNLSIDDITNMIEQAISKNNQNCFNDKFYSQVKEPINSINNTLTEIKNKLIVLEEVKEKVQTIARFTDDTVKLIQNTAQNTEKLLNPEKPESDKHDLREDQYRELQKLAKQMIDYLTDAAIRQNKEQDSNK